MWGVSIGKQASHVNTCPTASHRHQHACISASLEYESTIKPLGEAITLKMVCCSIQFRNSKKTAYIGHQVYRIADWVPSPIVDFLEHHSISMSTIKPYSLLVRDRENPWSLE